MIGRRGWWWWRRMPVSLHQANEKGRQQEERERREAGGDPGCKQLITLLLSKANWKLNQVWNVANEGECAAALRFHLASH